MNLLLKQCILRDNKALCKWKWRENITLPVTLSKDMMGRTSAWAGWPVDPRRSAGQAPHRPPRGAITHTRARLLAARRPTDARRLADPSTYNKHMPPPTGAPADTTHHNPCHMDHTPNRPRYTGTAPNATKARRVSPSNKASKAHPHIFTFTSSTQAQSGRLLTSPAPGLFSPGEVNTLTSIAPG